MNDVAAPLRVIVITPVRFFREGLTGFISRNPGFEVVGAAAGIGEALIAPGLPASDVALVDVQTPDGCAALSRVREHGPAKVVALAVRDEEADLMACIEAGAAGYVPQDASLDDVIRVLQAVARGETVCSPRVASLLFGRIATLAAQTDRHPVANTLTGRERQVVELLQRGFTNKDIARHLYIEVPTVKNHVHSILEKLGVRRRWEVTGPLPGLRDPMDLVPCAGGSRSPRPSE